MPQTIKGVEIFAVGTWNGFKFSADDLAEIAANTSALLAKKQHKPPLKLGHDQEQNLIGQMDGDPALGWIENVRVEGDKLLADFVDVPDIVGEAIAAKLYRQVSVELNHIDHFGWMLTAVALLGADLPAVKSLEDLQAYLSANNMDGAKMPIPVAFSVTPPIIEKRDPKPAATPKPKQAIMTEQEIRELQARLATLEKETEEKDKLLAAAAEDRRKADFTAAVSKALNPYEQAVADGKVTPAFRDKIRDALAAQEKTFSAGSTLNIPADLLFEAVTLPRGEQAIDDQAAKDETDRPDEALVAAAHKIMAERDKPFPDALEMAMKANPKLANAYKEQPYHVLRDWRA